MSTRAQPGQAGTHARRALLPGQLDAYVQSQSDDYALFLHDSEGAIHVVLVAAGLKRRAELLDAETTAQEAVRRFVKAFRSGLIGVEATS